MSTGAWLHHCEKIGLRCELGK